MREKIRSLNWKNMMIRLGAGLILLAVVISSGLFGGIAWFAVVSFLSLFGLFEFYRAFQIHKTAGAIIGYVFAAGYLALLWFDLMKYAPVVLVACFIVEMAVFVLRFTKSDLEKTLLSAAGIVYPVMLLSYLYLTRALPDGNLLVWYIFLGSWGADVFAYLIGILFGKHKMSPVVSPKKTWEGAAGGLAGAVVLGAVYGLIFKERFVAVEAPVLVSALLTGAASILSVFGDLTASAFKRKAEIKDYSNLIPGHGGVLDRFDSCIFVAPVVYYLALFFASK